MVSYDSDKINLAGFVVTKKFIFGISAAFFWAVAIVASRFVFKKGEDPYTLVLWTSLCAFPIWLYHSIKHRKEAILLNKQVLISLGVIGIVGSIGISIMEFLALQNTSAANFSLLIRSVVVFTVFFAFLFFKERITKKKMILVVLTLIGGFLLITDGKMITLKTGDVYTLIEAATIAFVNNILIKYTVSKIHPDFSAALSYFIGLFPIILFAIWAGAIKLPLSWLIVFIVVCCDVLLTQTRNRAYKLGTASFVTMMMSFTPVIASFLAFGFLSEGLSPVQLFGGFFIVSAGILSEKLKI